VGREPTAQEIRRARRAANERARRRDPVSGEATRTRERAYEAKNRKKRLAKLAVKHALRDGLMARKPCELCGKAPAHAHHDDYDEPLTVRWLCVVHHKAWHLKHGEGRNAR
jgi:hypothetical protein